MAIKIICNGKVSDTKIIDVASGAELQEDCIKAHIIIDAGGEQPEAVLYFTNVRLEVTAEVLETFPPAGLTLRRHNGNKRFMG